MRMTLLLSLLCFSWFADAAGLRPNSGLWWEEPVTGRFFAIEIAPSGKTYVVTSEFGADGKPQWTSMRGDLVVSTEAEQRAGAPLATLSAPVFELSGACPTCPPTSPGVRPIGMATIIFQTHAMAEYQRDAIRRPLRYFAPADQVADFPAARLAGDVVLSYRTELGVSTRPTALEPATDAPCVRYVGRSPPADSNRLRIRCPQGLCEGGKAGEFMLAFELAVGPGASPDFRGYTRSLAPEAISLPSVCTLVFINRVCTCPEGTSSEGARCVRNDRPMVCTESHLISEHAGTVQGLPLRSVDSSFQLNKLFP